MEKGTLIIRKTKKGFHVEIQYTKKSGKTGTLPVSSWQPEDNSLNETDCQFERDGGSLVKLVAHDGTVLYDRSVSTGRTTLGSPGNKSFSSVPEDSFSPAHTLLPEDTQTALRGINPDNFFLKWQRAARHSDKGSKNPFVFFRTHRGNVVLQIQPNFGDIDFELLASREQQNAERLLGLNNVRSFSFKTSWRLVQGLGMESVYEVSMTLHHVYGIPYIPATALKGVVRSWVIDRHFDSKEENAIADKTFCDWFGCPKNLESKKSYYAEARRGQLVFFDAFPTHAPHIKPDVMNPHYSDYYQDGKNEKPPADYYNPVPVYFLTVEATTFQFVFGARDNEVLEKQTIGGKAIEDWTKDALCNHGIGAKTSVGYGYMR